jgi:hypothetical protein
MGVGNIANELALGGVHTIANIGSTVSTVTSVAGKRLSTHVSANTIIRAVFSVGPATTRC